ncbi:O-antigen ligase [uncultured Chryseobacterium sp.]|nr:O-antigen ligase family protein [uncultured Chryseobacterium sp.]
MNSKHFIVILSLIFGIYIIKAPELRILMFVILNIIFISKYDYLIIFFVTTALLPYNAEDVNENYYTYVSYLAILLNILFNKKRKILFENFLFYPFLLIIPIIIILFKGSYLSHATSLLTTILSLILMSILFISKNFDIENFKLKLFSCLGITLLIPYFLYLSNIDNTVLVLTGYKGTYGSGFARMGTEKLDATAIYFPCILVFIFLITDKKIKGWKKYVFSGLILIPCVMSYSFGFFFTFFLVAIFYLIYNYNIKILLIYLLFSVIIVTNKTAVNYYQTYQESKKSLGALDSRTEVWEMSIDEIKKSPMWGSYDYEPKDIPIQYQEEGDFGSHNILLEIWRRAGVISVLIFLIFYFILPILDNKYSSYQSTLIMVATLFYFLILHFYSNKVALIALLLIFYSKKLTTIGIQNNKMS